ncbi:hypothetical protein C5C37_09875 [Rathayibacter sp. AY1F9]|nr:hypothetical protein C5C37_09875 [Rathayibacter sp. AY1F9]
MGPWTSGETIITSSQTCPVPGCSQRATILDARYTASPSGKLIAVPATMLGESQFRRLRKSLEQARRATQRGEEPAAVAAELQAELLSQLPGAAPAVEKARQSFGQWFEGPQSQAAATWLSVLIGLIALFVTLGSTGIADDQLQEIIEETVREYQQQEQAPSAPTPPVRPPGPEQGPQILDT